jgi:hypothetical protein
VLDFGKRLCRIVDAPNNMTTTDISRINTNRFNATRLAEHDSLFVSRDDIEVKRVYLLAYDAANETTSLIKSAALLGKALAEAHKAARWMASNKMEDEARELIAFITSIDIEL